jgi:integration host factor subunit alpha
MTGNEPATLTKDVLAEKIREKIGFSAKESKDILEMILELIKSTLEKGEEVKISGFGKWAVKDKRSRPGRNPHTGEKIDIEARRVVSFYVSDMMREKVNQQQNKGE